MVTSWRVLFHYVSMLHYIVTILHVHLSLYALHDYEIVVLDDKHVSMYFSHEKITFSQSL